MDMNKENAMRELMAADFTALDLALYLNTHPYDTRALSLYCNAVQHAKMLMMNYERMYGPLTHYSAASNTNSWQWALTPWPWERH
jgi:spore coat protein JB